MPIEEADITILESGYPDPGIDPVSNVLISDTRTDPTPQQHHLAIW